MDEFTYYIKKMQELLKNPKLTPLLNRRRSRELVQMVSISVEEKKEKVEKIRTMIKDNKTNINAKEITSNIIDSFNKAKDSNTDIVNQQLSTQEDAFKKRLEEKRMCRTNSQPHMKLKVRNIYLY